MYCDQCSNPCSYSLAQALSKAQFPPPHTTLVHNTQAAGARSRELHDAALHAERDLLMLYTQPNIQQPSI